MVSLITKSYCSKGYIVIDASPNGEPVSFTGFVFTIGPLEHQEREVELGKRRKLFSVYDVHEEIGR